MGIRKPPPESGAALFILFCLDLARGGRRPTLWRIRAANQRCMNVGRFLRLRVRWPVFRPPQRQHSSKDRRYPFSFPPFIKNFPADPLKGPGSCAENKKPFRKNQIHFISPIQKRPQIAGAVVHFIKFLQSRQITPAGKYRIKNSIQKIIVYTSFLYEIEGGRLRRGLCIGLLRHYLSFSLITPTPFFS